MAAIRIRVGASLDRSTLAAFQPIVESAKRARKAVADELEKQTKQQATEQRAQTKAAEREARQRAAAEKEALRDVDRATKQAARERERAAQMAARSAVKAAKESAAEQTRIQQQTLKEAERSAAARDRFASRASGTLFRGAASAARAAIGVAGSLARGMGVDTDLGSAFTKNTDLQTRAVQLSNSGYMPGKNYRQNPQTIVDKSRDVANATAMDAGDVMGGMQKFVGKTGDLRAAQDMIGELARLSKATGTNLEDMADAAADVFTQTGSAEKTVAVMKAIAAQGKEGAVEIKDLADQMAKVAGAASQFEGDSGKNIALFGALAQFARQKGAASTATQAATSTLAFQSTFGKGARLDAFKKYKVNTDGAGGKVRNAEDIIVDALVATKGNKRKFNEMFASSQAQRVTDPFRTSFLDKFDKAKGTEQERLAQAAQETRAEFDRLRDSTMSEQELTDSFNAAMDTAGSRAQLFNNAIQQNADKLQNALYPALIALAPMILKLATATADAITQITGVDPRKKALDKTEDSLTFGSAATTGNALTSGEISQADLDRNKDAEKALQDVVDQRKAAAKTEATAQGGIPKAVSGLLNVFQYTPVGAAVGGGDIKSDFERNRQQKLDAANVGVSTAEKHLADLKAQNKKLTDAIEGGALKVTIVAGTSPAPVAKLGATATPGSDATK